MSQLCWKKPLTRFSNLAFSCWCRFRETEKPSCQSDYRYSFLDHMWYSPISWSSDQGASRWLWSSCGLNKSFCSSRGLFYMQRNRVLFLQRKGQLISTHPHSIGDLRFSFVFLFFVFSGIKHVTRELIMFCSYNSGFDLVDMALEMIIGAGSVFSLFHIGSLWIFLGFFFFFFWLLSFFILCS